MLEQDKEEEEVVVVVVEESEVEGVIVQVDEKSAVSEGVTDVELLRVLAEVDRHASTDKRFIFYFWTKEMLKGRG